ncbi:hypothetical protein D3C83_202310 [compost metagenome]
MGFVPDEEGRELPDLGAAEDFAVDSIRSILKDELDTGRLDLRGRIDIADGGGQVLAVVPFDRAVELRLQQGPA